MALEYRHAAGSYAIVTGYCRNRSFDAFEECVHELFFMAQPYSGEYLWYREHQVKVIGV